MKQSMRLTKLFLASLILPLALILPSYATTTNSSSVQQDVFFCDFISAANISDFHRDWKCSSSIPIGSICKWAGVSCSDCGSITQIDVSYMSLSGTIPTSIGLLTDLISINMLDNSLGGNIPTQIGLLKKLSFFAVGNNKFTGVIPTELGFLSSLNVFHAKGNSLSGQIPSALCAQSNIAYYDFSENSEYLCYPSCFTKLTRVDYIGLHQCGRIS